MNRSTATALGLVAALVTIVTIISVSWIMDRGDHHAKPKPAPRQLDKREAPGISAREAGEDLAGVVNANGRTRLRPALCAYLQGRRYSCSFYQTHPRGCRYVKFDLIDGEVIPRVSGLVPETFCPERVR